MKTLAMALFLFALGMLTTRCEPNQLPEPGIVEKRARNAIDFAAYDRELAGCQEVGRDAGAYAAYEACASSVDRKYGVKP